MKKQVSQNALYSQTLLCASDQMFFIGINFKSDHVDVSSQIARDLSRPYVYTFPLVIDMCCLTAFCHQVSSVKTIRSSEIQDYLSMLLHVRDETFDNEWRKSWLLILYLFWIYVQVDLLWDEVTPRFWPLYFTTAL